MIFHRNPLATAGLVLIATFTVFAIFAPWLAPQDPAHIELATRLSPPSTAHWFGTDELGRDIFSRIIVGARISMLVGSCVVGASLFLGLIAGCLAGYYGGRVDRFFNVVVMNAFLSFPGILLAIAFVRFSAPDSGTSSLRSRSAAGLAMLGLCAHKCWPRASANSLRPRVPLAPVIGA